ncbi:zinc ribbon domain-containing protein [Hamadaea sp. NPDC050747]|uniref:zinc ribbon domain-containing protein n=1 Tax=Hamadaea sp. NPDC050747 TaxID=3155789 RepID=UPI0033D1B820
MVDADLFEQCQQIMQARGEAGSRRAASNSDYQLTGLIICPECGCKYIGTSATGKRRGYRYYTRFSRARYGKAGCAAHRIDADLVDEAVTQALIDFYGRTDLIADTITAERSWSPKMPSATAKSSRLSADRSPLPRRRSTAT